MDQQSLIRLFDYHYWANHQLWCSVMELSDQQFTQPLSDGSPSIRTQVVRMVANENLWVNYLWHGEVEFLQEYQLPTRASIQAEWDALEEEICDFLDVLHPRDLERQVIPPFLNPGVPLKTWEIMVHIVQYAAEYRAQLRLHLDHLGSPAPSQDFFNYLHEGCRVTRESYPFSPASRAI